MFLNNQTTVYWLITVTTILNGFNNLKTAVSDRTAEPVADFD